MGQITCLKCGRVCTYAGCSCSCNYVNGICSACQQTKNTTDDIIQETKDIINGYQPSITETSVQEEESIGLWN